MAHQLATFVLAAPQGPSAQEIQQTIRQAVDEATREAVREAQQQVRESQQQVREAQQQVREAQQQIREAAQQRREARTPDQRGAADQAMFAAQQQLREAQRELQRVQAQTSTEQRVVIDPNPDFPQIPAAAVDVAIGFFITCAVIVVGWPISRALGRRFERRGAPPALEPAIAEQLQRIEQAVEAVAIEVERISEGQRFLTRLQERTASPVE